MDREARSEDRKGINDRAGTVREKQKKSLILRGEYRSCISHVAVRHPGHLGRDRARRSAQKDGQMVAEHADHRCNVSCRGKYLHGRPSSI